LSLLESPIVWLIGICGAIIAFVLLAFSGKSTGTTPTTGTGTGTQTQQAQANTVSNAETQMKQQGYVSTASPQVEVYHNVDLSTIDKIAAYYGFDAKTVQSYAWSYPAKINVLFKNGEMKVYVNPNELPKTVTYIDETGATKTTEPASASKPQSSVMQPVDVNNPPPIVSWANDFNRINIAGTSLNRDSYYHEEGITNCYGTYYTGYGTGTLKIEWMPNGTTIGGLTPQAWKAKYGSGGSTAPANTPAPAPTPAPQPAPNTTGVTQQGSGQVTVNQPQAQAATKPIVKMNTDSEKAAAMNTARGMGYSGPNNYNSLVDFWLVKGYRVQYLNDWYG
jgi:hypothetical protein